MPQLLAEPITSTTFSINSVHPDFTDATLEFGPGGTRAARPFGCSDPRGDSAAADDRGRAHPLSRSNQLLKPHFSRCSPHPSGPFPSISPSLSPFGCRPSRIASTMSGARQVSGSRRQT